MMNKTSLLPRPDRIVSLDVLRGIAVLGILIVNIQSFSMISAAYMNPTAYGDLNGINKTAWMFIHIFGDQKFLSIFSMLFGAGIILFADNVESKGYLPSRFYYRRLFWLFTIGLIHGYLLWHGDILVAYAVCGALAFLFRNLNPMVLLALGIILFTVPAFNYWIFGNSMEMWPEQALAGIRDSWAPAQALIDQEIAFMRGSIVEQLKWRIPETFKMETFIFLIYLGWRILGTMMIGMGLYKFGFLSSKLSVKNYLVIATTTLIPGFLLIAIGVNKNFEAGWSVEYSMFFGSLWNYHGSLLVAIGYAAIIMIATKYINLNIFARAGKMSFTVYLFTTLICTFIFYGTGLGLFGKMERWEQLVTVFVIWIVLLVFSWFWLEKFKYGPVEWLWRYLTYGNKPAMKRSGAPSFVNK